jgi:hypothetical protein
MKLVSVSGEKKDGLPKIVHFTTLEQCFLWLTVFYVLIYDRGIDNLEHLIKSGVSFLKL